MRRNTPSSSHSRSSLSVSSINENDSDDGTVEKRRNVYTLSKGRKMYELKLLYQLALFLW